MFYFKFKKFFSYYLPTVLIVFVILGFFFFYVDSKEALAGWYSSGSFWSYRKAIVISKSKVPSTQFDFPILVDITDSDLQANAQSDGDDVLFTLSDGTTKLSHETEIYTSSTGRLTAWVRIPYLSSAVDTTIYMYYGNVSASSQQDATGVWDSNYKSVFHLPNGTSLTANDSTSNSNNGVVNGSVSAVFAKVEGGASFVSGSGNNIKVTAASSININGASTWEGWVNFSKNNEAYWVKNDGNTVSSGWVLSRDSSDNLRLTLEGASTNARIHGTTVLSSDTWYHFLVTWDGASIGAISTHVTMYINGNQETLSTVQNGVGVHTDTSDMYIGGSGGQYTDTASNFGGKLDELRLSNAVRPFGWAKTGYNNQSATSTFYTIGNQETPSRSSSTPAVAARGVGGDEATVKARGGVKFR